MKNTQKQYDTQINDKDITSEEAYNTIKNFKDIYSKACHHFINNNGKQYTMNDINENMPFALEKFINKNEHIPSGLKKTIVSHHLNTSTTLKILGMLSTVTLIVMSPMIFNANVNNNKEHYDKDKIISTSVCGFMIFSTTLLMLLNKNRNLLANKFRSFIDQNNPFNHKTQQR